MKLKGISHLVLITLLTSFILAGCYGIEVETPVGEKVTETVLVTDSLNRQVEVPKQVNRVAALHSFAGYAVSILNGGDLLVAVQGGLQRDVLLGELVPNIANTSVVREGGTINIEELMRINPDVVIIRAEAIADEKERDKLEKTNIPYVVIEYSDINGQKEVINIIGKAIGRELEAKAFNDYFDNVLNRVNKIAEQIPENKKVRVYHSENQVLRTTGNDTLTADWAKRSGFINVAINQPLQLQDGNYFTSIEQVLLWNPDVVIANEETAYKYILGHPQWSGLDAVKNNKVYKLPQGVSRWGHDGSIETPLAMLWIVKTLYPEKAADIDMHAETRDFYKKFYRVSLQDDKIGKILSGQGLRKEKGD